MLRHPFSPASPLAPSNKNNSARIGCRSLQPTSSLLSHGGKRNAHRTLHAEYSWRLDGGVSSLESFLYPLFTDQRAATPPAEQNIFDLGSGSLGITTHNMPCLALIFAFVSRGALETSSLAMPYLFTVGTAFVLGRYIQLGIETPNHQTEQI